MLFLRSKLGYIWVVFSTYFVVFTAAKPHLFQRPSQSKLRANSMTTRWIIDRIIRLNQLLLIARQACFSIKLTNSLCRIRSLKLGLPKSNHVDQSFVCIVAAFHDTKLNENFSKVAFSLKVSRRSSKGPQRNASDRCLNLGVPELAREKIPSF